MFPECMHVHFICHLDQWRPEEGEVPLELELQIIMNHHMDAGSWTLFSARAVNALDCGLTSLAWNCKFFCCSEYNESFCMKSIEL